MCLTCYVHRTRHSGQPNSQFVPKLSEILRLSFEPPLSSGVYLQTFWILESRACSYVDIPFSLIACIQYLNTFSKMSFIFLPPTEIWVKHDAVKKTEHDHHCTNYIRTKWKVHLNSSVGTVTRYGLDGPEIEFWLGRDFSKPSKPALGPTQLKTAKTFIFIDARF